MKKIYFSTLKSDSSWAKLTLFSTGEISAVHADEIGEERRLTPDHCGILPNNCLPCLSSNPPSIEKRRQLSPPDTPSSRRKSLSILSFKWREGPSDTALREWSQYFSRLQAFSLCFCCIFRNEFESEDTLLAYDWALFTSQAMPTTK